MLMTYTAYTLLLQMLHKPAVRQGARRSKKSISYPWICKFYNSTGGCKHGEAGNGCTAMHVCVHFVQGNCIFGRKCRRSHNIYNSQSRPLLEKAGVDVNQNDVSVILELRKALQVADAPSSKQQASTSYR